MFHQSPAYYRARTYSRSDVAISEDRKGKMVIKTREEQNLKHFTITQKLVEKFNREENLSDIEKKELGCTDAKICAMRMGGDVYLLRNEQRRPKQIIENQTEYIRENGAHRTLFPRLLEDDPHYLSALEEKKILESLLETLAPCQGKLGPLSETTAPPPRTISPLRP